MPKGTDLLRQRFPDTPESRLADAEAKVVHDIAQLLYDARVAEGLTQAELAQRAQTTQSGIARQEDPDYRGFKLSTLARLFAALDLELVITVQPIKRSARRPARAAAARKKSPPTTTVKPKATPKRKT